MLGLVVQPRVITYRASRKFTADPAMAVVVQQMINSEQSGVAFTADPNTGARDRVVVEAAFGLGEVVVSGEVEPDTYVVDKQTHDILDVRIGHKDFKIVRGVDGHDHDVPLGPEQADARVLDDAQLKRVAELAIAIERHNECPQDVEWAIAGGNVWLVQARPITTLHPPADHPDLLARGLPAAPGISAGTVRVLISPKDGSRLLDGEVLVAPMTNPDWLPTIRRAAGLVTDTGGMTCHAAIVARELGIPCVVGTRSATKDLSDGVIVTVDGGHGRGNGRPVLSEAGRGDGEIRFRGERRRGHRDEDLRQPRDAGCGRGRGEPAGRRGRVAARRVRAHRGAVQPSPA